MLEADIAAFEAAIDIEVRPIVYRGQSAGEQRAFELSWLRDGVEGFSVDLLDEVRVCVISFLKRLRQETEKELFEAEAGQLRLDAEYGKPAFQMPAWQTHPAPSSRPAWMNN
jgi:hypothetical protein